MTDQPKPEKPVPLSFLRMTINSGRRPKGRADVKLRNFDVEESK